MRSEYDFSKSRKNPYGNQLKRQVTIRLDTAASELFQGNGGRIGNAISKPYQSVPEKLRYAETARHSMAHREAERAGCRLSYGEKQNREKHPLRKIIPSSKCSATI